MSLYEGVIWYGRREVGRGVRGKGDSEEIGRERGLRGDMEGEGGQS